ncbi:dual-specificity kinase, partial [Phenoliferia sp. Uapishka_3]
PSSPPPPFLMSRVATRNGASSSTSTIANAQAARRQPYPPPARGAGVNGQAGASSSTSSYAAPRRAARPEYRVEQIIRNGVGMEVITIEDSPDPPPRVAGPSVGTSASAYASSSRSYGTAGQHQQEPAYKKRKSDGMHISDQPYAESHPAAYRNGAQEGSSYAPANGNGHYSNGASSKNKRKHDAYEGYANSGRDSATSSRDSAQRPAQRVKEKERPKKEEPVNDKEGHFIVRVNDYIGEMDRFKITRSLGQGTFGKVVCAYDQLANREVAIKVIRAVPKYREASKVEIKVLKLIKQQDPENKYKCIHLLETFDHRNHVCLVTELLSASVFDFLKENSYQPFPISQIQSFARQLFESVEFLHRMKLIHTDLKPENILLESTEAEEYKDSSKKSSKVTKILKSTAIRLIDFGSATFDNEYHATVVSTRHYRAPEIILGTGWSYECDVWSIGCILIEFFTGEALFQTHENVEHLAMMERVFGRMPDAYRQKAYQAVSPNHPDWFETERVGRSLRATKLNFPVLKPSSVANAQAVTSKQSIKFVKQMKTLQNIVPQDSGIATQRFLNLLEKLLVWEPKERLTVKDALSHPFFRASQLQFPFLVLELIFFASQMKL